MDTDRKTDVTKIFSQLMKLRHSLVHLRMDNMELHRGQSRILFHLVKASGISQKELAEAMGVAPSTMTLSINRMESAGLLCRVSDQDDQRVKRIVITDKGRDVDARIRKVVDAVESACFEGIGDDELEALGSVFARMLANIQGLIDQEKKGGESI